MITATIIGVSHIGTQVFVQYQLTSGRDGQIEVPIGSSPDDINNQIGAIVDAANYTDSLAPIIGTTVQSAVPAPKPVSVSAQSVTVGAQIASQVVP